MVPGCHTFEMQIPLACTLTAASAGERVEEWRRFLARFTSTVEWISERHLRLRLVGTSHAVLHARDLARREKACCEFFDFAIEREADASWLSVRVPPDASGILSEFASLLPR
jgi:hypothetical protein